MYAFLLLPFSVLSQRGDLRLTSGGASGLVVAEALDPKVVLHVLILGVVTLSAGGQLGQLRVLQCCQIVPWRWFQTFVWGSRQCRVGGGGSQGSRVTVTADVDTCTTLSL